MALYQCPTEYDGSQFQCTGDNPAGTFCNDLPGENGRPVAPRIIFERVFNNPQQNGNPPWVPLPPEDGDEEHATPYCQELPEDHVVTQEEIQAVNFQVFQKLTGLEIDVSPDSPGAENRTLVNLSTIVSTRYPATVGDLGDDVIVWEPEADPPHIRIQGQVLGKVEPFIYTIDARATINWTFDGGKPHTAEGRGRAFDGTLPEDATDGYYVTAQFQKAGTYTISLGATWDGEVTVDGRTEPMDAVVIDAVSERIQVSQAKSVITD
ncbi:cupredoxin domain-containing protein [Flindersiella endophytica]